MMFITTKSSLRKAGEALEAEMKLIKCFERRGAMRFWLLINIFLIIASIRSHTADASIKSVPVNIVVLTPDPNKTIDRERAAKFIAILNAGYRSQSGEKIFDFKLKSFHRIDDILPNNCERLIELGDQNSKPEKNDVYAAFDECQDVRVVDHHSINVFLFRSKWDNDQERKSSRIYFHSFEPFVFMNVDRLDNDWNVWVHEFGHVFGLPETPACGSTTETPTNPMGHQFDFCEGTGGNRKLGFEAWQGAIAKATYMIIAKKLSF